MQKVFRKVFWLVCLGICMSGFSQIDTSGMEKSRSGIYFKLSEILSEETPQIGDHLLVDIVKFNEEGEVLFNTMDLENMNGVEIVLTKPNYQGDIMEIFSKMSKGSTANLYVLMDSVDRDFLSATDVGKYYGYELTMLDFTSDKVYRKQQNKHGKQQLKKDHRALRKEIKNSEFASKKRVDKGLFITWSIDLNSEHIKLNDTIKVHYIGSLLDGTQFDSSRDRGEAFQFVFNEKNVIKGWGELLPFVGLGDRVMLYIASKYAYGRTGTGRDIGPDEPLLFDVEILELNDQKFD